MPLLRRSLSLLVLASSPAFAQSVNVDVGGNLTFPAPAATYAAAGSAGIWNAIAAPANAQPVAALDGSPTSVTLTSSGGFLNFEFDHPGTSGDDQALMDDCHDLGGASTMVTWTFQGLSNGEYDVITYAWAPDSATFRTRVAVTGSSDPAVDVGGPWPGALAQGVTHARHHVSVAAGSIAVVLSVTNGFGSLNGIQLVQGIPPQIVCAGDGSGAACPCGNASAPGSGDGCLHSFGNAGRLRASGTASVASDTLVLLGTQMTESSVLYFQGTLAVAGGAGAPFGDGLRCAGGSVVRLGPHTNVGGASQYPSGSDVAIHTKGAVSAGDVRTYQAWYRNSASFCQPEGFNLTNGVRVTWQL